MSNPGTITYLKPLERTLRSGYLVTVRRRGQERQMIWYPPASLRLDLAGEWELSWATEGISARQFAIQGKDRKPKQIVPIPDQAFDRAQAHWVALVGARDDHNGFQVRIERLKPVPAPFRRTGPSPENGLRQTFLFYGAGATLHGYSTVGSTFRVSFEGKSILRYRLFNGRHEIFAERKGVLVSPPSRGAEELPESERYLLTDDEWHGCEFRVGSFWWRTLVVAVPEPFLPDSAQGSESSERTFRNRMRLGAALTGVLLFVLLGVQRHAPTPRNRETTVSLAPPRQFHMPNQPTTAPMLVEPAPQEPASEMAESKAQTSPAPDRGMAVAVPRPPAQANEPRLRATPDPDFATEMPRPRRDIPDASYGEDPRVRSQRHARRLAEKKPELTITGSGRIEKSSVERTLERHLGNFQQCYAELLATNPTAKGIVELEWTILRNGTATDVVVAKSDIPNDKLLTCVGEELRRTSFSRPDGGAVRVRFPLVFSNGT